MAVAGQRLQRATVNRTQGGPPRTARPLTLDAARASWRALPRGTQRTHSTPSSVTTVSSTGIFLAPRSARRSDASNAAGWTAGGSLWRQRQPGRKWRARVQTPAAHAQPGWHRRLAPRSARRSDASDAAGRTAGGGRRRHWQTAGCGARAFKRLRRTRSRAGIGASLRAPRVARTPQTQPGSRRAKACGAKSRLAGFGARVQTQPGSGRQRKNLRRTHARARAAALVRSCVGATRRRDRAIPPAAPTLGRDRPNSPFGVRARRRGWASTLRAGERLTTLTSPPLDQNVRAHAPPRALPASHLTDGRRMAAKAPRGAMEILCRALSGS